MQILIDIPKGFYEYVKSHKNVFNYGLVNGEKLGEIIANGTPIPDNAKNGDVVKATTNFIGVQDEEDTIKISTTWWNAPYQKGGK